jgi:DNA replication protein DnaC
VSPEFVHEIISERYERRSTIITSNLDFQEWQEAFPNKLLGAATIDRIRHGAYRVVLDGKSCRRERSIPETPKKPLEKGGENH